MVGVQLTQEMIQGAIDTQSKYGVPASVTLGQILLESGGNYPGGLSGLAYKDNNLFGIKAPSGYTGAKVSYTTWEESNGIRYQTQAYCKVYTICSATIIYHGKLLNQPIYTNQTNSATNLTEYVQKMGSVYATASNYADTLLGIINNNNLTQYDDGSLPTGNISDYGSSTSTGSSTSNGIFNFDFSWIYDVLKWLVVLFVVIIGVFFFLKSFDIELI